MNLKNLVKQIEMAKGMEETAIQNFIATLKELGYEDSCWNPCREKYLINKFIDITYHHKCTETGEEATLSMPYNNTKSLAKILLENSPALRKAKELDEKLKQIRKDIGFLKSLSGIINDRTKKTIKRQRNLLEQTLRDHPEIVLQTMEFVTELLEKK